MYANGARPLGSMSRSLPGGVFTQKVLGRLVTQSRGSDIPDEILDGDLDVGFCGSDVMIEGWLAGRYAPLGFNALVGAGCDVVLAGLEGLDTKKPLRIVTKYPLSAYYYLDQRGYEVESITQRGGKMEGKLRSGKYDAIVDLRESGETLKDNDLVVVDMFDSVQTGLVYRKQAYDRAAISFEPWRLYAEAQTLNARKQQYDEGLEPETGRKSTLGLIANPNARRKNLGEECAELVAADATGENALGEAADVSFATKVTAVANGITSIRLLNEELDRNTKPTLWLPK